MAGSMDSTFPTADGIALDIAARQQQDDKPPSKKKSPGEWVQGNLFNTKMNTAITVILTPIALYLAYRFARFVFVTGQWEVLDVNLRLFMTGTYPQEEIWRIAWQVIGSATAAGLVAGLLRSAARDKAVETGEPMVQTSIREYLSSYWSIALFVGICMVFFVNTAGPWMVLVGSIIGAVVGWLITSRFTEGLRPYGWSLAGLVAAGSFPGSFWNRWLGLAVYHSGSDSGRVGLGAPGSIRTANALGWSWRHYWHRDHGAEARNLQLDRSSDRPLWGLSSLEG